MYMCILAVYKQLRICIHNWCYYFLIETMLEVERELRKKMAIDLEQTQGTCSMH